MDYNKMAKERDPLVDIESDGSESEEDARNGLVTGNRRAKGLLRSLGGTLNFEGSDDSECSSNSNRSSRKASDDEIDDIESLNNNKRGGDKVEHMPLVDKTRTQEKHRTSKSKKAPKPPRPRKGPSLDISDLQLVREISELAMKKRARIERLKALKKMRAAKSSSTSSSKSSLFALVITVLFFLVIIFQGQSSTLSFQESPEPPSAAATSRFVSVQNGNNILESDDLQQISKPPSIIEETSSSEPSTWVK